MWEPIVRILANIHVVLVLLGTLLLLLGIVGRLVTRWFTISLSWLQRIGIAFLGGVLLVVGLLPVLPPNPVTSTPTMRDMLLGKQGEGNFEWQWAGQNWYGRVRFREGANSNIEADLDVRKIFKRSEGSEFRIKMGPSVLKNGPENRASIVLHRDHIELKSTVVRKNTFRSVTLSKDFAIEGIDIENSTLETLYAPRLEPIPAFGGKVRFRNPTTGQESEGDMVLVKYPMGFYVPWQ